MPGEFAIGERVCVLRGPAALAAAGRAGEVVWVLRDPATDAVLSYAVRLDAAEPEYVTTYPHELEREGGG